MGANKPGAAKTGANRGQFSLLLTRRFSPFFITQALGAFNDNVYRNAVIVLIVFGGPAAEADTLANLGAALFALPFFLFSAWAGEIADHGDKAALTRRIKIAEVCIMFLGGFAVASGAVWAVMAVLFLMGTQSTFFGPIKYAIIPQHLRQAELVGGNGLVQMGTFVAIPAGLMLGGLLAAAEPAPIRPWLIGASVVGLAAAGYLASRFIPAAPPAPDAGRICWNPLPVIARMGRAASAKRSVLLSILGISWFWLLGSVVLTQMPNYGNQILNASETVTTALMATLAIGIGAGSMVCEWLSGRRVEIGLTPIGSLGLSVFAARFALTTMSPVTPDTGFAQFLAAGGWGPGLDLFLIGFFGGLYVVPMYSVIQQRTPAGNARPRHRFQQHRQLLVPGDRRGPEHPAARVLGLQHSGPVPGAGRTQPRGRGVHFPGSPGIRGPVHGLVFDAQPLPPALREPGPRAGAQRRGAGLQPRQLR